MAKANQQTAAAAEPAYSIDPNAIARQGRAIGDLAADRLCAGALTKVKRGASLREADLADVRTLAREQCGSDPEFLSARLPVLEAVFRVLLVSKEEAVPVSALAERLTELWKDTPWPRHITTETLERLLAHANYYGIMRVKSAG